MNLTTQHIFILRKLDKLCQELCDMDTKELIEVHDNLIKESNKHSKYPSITRNFQEDMIDNMDMGQ